MTWLPHATVAAIIPQDDRFLMVQERTRGGQIVFNQPAGHLDEGESLIDAVIREVREETAWGFVPENLVGIYRWQVPPNGATYLRFCFSGHCHDHDPDRELDHCIIRAAWMTRHELALEGERLRSPMVLRCINDYLDGIRYPLDILNDMPL